MQNILSRYLLLGLSLLLNAVLVAQDDNEEYFNNEYINENFTGWTAAGTAGSTNTWASGSETIVCVDDIERTFSFSNCVVNPIDNVNAADCPYGSILLRNSNNGILTLPLLPNVGRIIIGREGKTPDRNVKLWLQAYENGIWVNKEADGITATTGCQTYEYAYKSDTEVQLRFVLAGNSATRLYWLYVEGPGGGSGTPLNPDDNLPVPDESTVTILDDLASQVAFETLVGVSSYGWDPKNKGIYINWHREFTNRINSDSGGAFDERDTNTRHDSQNDIRALQHYYWFKSLHQNTPYFDRAIQRILPTVKSKFSKPTSLKGWMYFVLLRLKELTDDPADMEFWNNAVLFWANNVYNTIDPEEGVFFQTNMGNCDCGSQTIYLDKAYRVDHQVEAGAALVHAGTLYNRQEWITAGYRQVLTAYEQAFAENYGLFGRIYLMGNSGYKNNSDGTKTYFDYSAFSGKLWDGQAKLGEVSEEVDALLRAAEITNDPEIKSTFIEIASKMLDALRIQPIHDKIRGGFYQVMHVADGGEGNKAGSVSASKKEMRQASLLGTYNLANRLIPGERWNDMEREMYWLLMNSFSSTPKGMFLPDIEQNPQETYNGYRKSLAGYSYQLAPDWNIYFGKVAENWVSNESNSLALLGIFEYLDAKYNLNYNTDHIASVVRTPEHGMHVFYIDGDLLYVKVPLQKMLIFDATGRLIMQNSTLSGSVSLHMLQHGMYIVKAVMENGMIVQSRFIK